MPRLEAILQKHGSELAAIITEPIMANMGCILPRDGYLQQVCDLAQRYGALFILDEVVTGFRYAPGGCQQFYNLKPDLSTFGKALGAGFPIGAVAGPRAILDRMRWSEHMVLHYGTFNGHRLTMNVVAANLDLLSAEGAYRKLFAIGDAAIAGLREVFRRRNVKAIVQGFGPMFQIYFTEREGDPRLPRLLPVRGHGEVFALRPSPARPRHLHDALEWPALDHLDRAYGQRRGRTGGCRRPGLLGAFVKATVFLGGGRITAALLAGLRLAKLPGAGDRA